MAPANLLHPVRRYFVMSGCDRDDLRRWQQEGGWMCLHPCRGGVVLNWKVVPLWEESLSDVGCFPVVRQNTRHAHINWPHTPLCSRRNSVSVCVSVWRQTSNLQGAYVVVVSQLQTREHRQPQNELSRPGF